MNTDIITQGSIRNTLSLEYQLFWNLEKMRPLRVSTVNTSLCSISHGRYTRWAWQLLKESNNNFLIDASYDGCLEIVNLMLERGANYYNTAMGWASKNDHQDIVKLMLDLGATDYNQAMINASAYGHFEIVKWMVQKGASDYKMALELARHYKHRKIIEYLTSLMSEN